MKSIQGVANRGSITIEMKNFFLTFLNSLCHSLDIASIILVIWAFLGEASMIDLT